MTSMRSTVTRLALTLVLAAAIAPASAIADRRYFVESYTPDLESAGNLEMEVWSTALAGQGDSTGTAWENRAEFEVAVTDRLTGAFYLNFIQAAGDAGASRFDGPSLELIYALAERGRIPLDPAVYLEARENGQELEVEPKLLVAQRRGPVVAAANLIGEFETHHAGEERGETEKSMGVTAGLSRELGAAVALGIEASFRRDFDAGAGSPSAIFAGPTINLQTEKLQMALGWHPQLWGDPASAARLDLRDFSRSEFRLILGVDL